MQAASSTQLQCAFENCQKSCVETFAQILKIGQRKNFGSVPTLKLLAKLPLVKLGEKTLPSFYWATDFQTGNLLQNLLA